MKRNMHHAFWYISLLSLHTSTWNFLMRHCLNTLDEFHFTYIFHFKPVGNILIFCGKNKANSFLWHFRCPHLRSCWSALYFMSLSSAWHFHFGAIANNRKLVWSKEEKYPDSYIGCEFKSLKSNRPFFSHLFSCY